MAVLKYKDDNGNYQPVVGVNVQNEVVLTTGTSITAVMSQEAVTDALSEKANSSDVYTKTLADTLLTAKVDKITGKGLSTNDFDDTSKDKLDNLPSTSEAAESGGTDISLVTTGEKYTWNDKQNALVSGTNIKTINSQSILGSGNIEISGASVDPSATTPLMDGTASVGTENAYARGDHRHPSDTTKVDKVTGKGLSTNDYTTEEKTKLAGIEAGATKVTTLDDVSDGSTRKLADYLPLSGVVQTTGQSTTAVMSQKASTDSFYTKSQVDAKISFSYDSTTKGMVFPSDTSIVEYDSTTRGMIFH